MLRENFDEIGREGVFARPEDLNINVEHVSPSFLVHKPSGGYRLVTAFTSIREYSETLPTITLSIEEALKTIVNRDSY